MEYAVYRIYHDADGRKMGSYVNMLASREEAEELAESLPGEHEVVGLWTREISEAESGMWDTVVFSDGGVEPVAGTGREETEE